MTPSNPLTATEVRAVVDAYVATYRANDREACVRLFAPDAVWHDPVGEPPHEGHEGIRAFWDQARALASSIVLVPNDVIVCANEAVMIFEIHVELPGTPPSTMIMDAVELFVIGPDGLISELRAYWDMSRARSRG